MKLILSCATLMALSALPDNVNGHAYMEIPMAR